jgi:glucosamine 6-phosphate synthetase-like amidotransferase/phosphosugar isomerase protein
VGSHEAMPRGCLEPAGERELGKIADAVFMISDTHSLLSPIVFTIPLQLLAYLAVLRGADGISHGLWPRA